MNESPQERLLAMQKEDEQLDQLGRDGLCLLQKKSGYHFSEDAVILAHLTAQYMKALTPASPHFVDLGSHSGVVALLFSALLPQSQGFAVELFPRLVDMMQRNFVGNGMSSRLRALQADLRDWRQAADLAEAGVEFGRYDLALFNPPYEPKREGGQDAWDSLPAPKQERLAAIHEQFLPLADGLQAAALSLRHHGRLAGIYRMRRMPALLLALQKAGFGIERLRPIQTKSDKDAELFWFVALKGGTMCQLTCEKALVIRLADGGYSPEMLSFYPELQGAENAALLRDAPNALPRRGEDVEETGEAIEDEAAAEGEAAEAPEGADLARIDPSRENLILSDRAPAQEQGSLTLIGTPIGHLGDLSPRAREALDAVDRLLCEDSRVTGHLLQQLQIHKPLLSYHQHNQAKREGQVLDLLAAGQHLGLVSDAGMPCISDPGQALVAAVRRAGYPVRVIPGPSAGLVALAASGLDSRYFHFEGFLPRKAGERKRRLEEIKHLRGSLIFYEAPHRLEEMLQALAEVGLGQRALFIGRELSKRYEEHWLGTAEQALERYRQGAKIRGEYVLVMEGESKEQQPAEIMAQAEADSCGWQAWLAEALHTGMKAKTIRQTLVERWHMDRNEAYRRYLEAKEEQEGQDLAEDAGF